MIYFLIFTLLFWAAHCAFLFFFFIMIQAGQALDILFNYQNLLRRFYASDKTWKNLLGKAIGDCELCTTFWTSPLMFLLYYLFVNSLGYWIVEGVTANLIWFFVYWVLSGSIAFYYTKPKENGL